MSIQNGRRSCRLQASFPRSSLTNTSRMISPGFSSIWWETISHLAITPSWLRPKTWKQKCRCTVQEAGKYNFFSHQTAAILHRYMGQIEKKGNSLRVYMYFQNILHWTDQITPKLLLKRVILHWCKNRTMIYSDFYYFFLWKYDYWNANNSISITFSTF